MPDAEFEGLLELLAMLLFDWRTGTLILLLTVAAVSDCRSQRIPNRLVLAGLIFGVLYNAILPPTPRDNIWFPLAGLCVGLLAFLPFYLLRAMGAGDVKLMAMIGAFLGPIDIFYAVLASMIAGGALAAVHTLAHGTALRLLRNFKILWYEGFSSMFSGSMPTLRIDPVQSAGKLPYGVAIAVGTSAYLVLHQLGFLR